MHNFEVDKIFMETKEVSLKARVIIYNKKDKKIILCNYAGAHLLPGGSIEKNEDPKYAVKREVEEETGLVFGSESFKSLFVYSAATRDYITRNQDKINKALIEFVFFVDYDNLLEEKQNKLTDKEKKDNFSYFWISINEAIKKIENNNTKNPRASFYAGPLLDILYKINDIINPKEIIFINEVTIKGNNILNRYREDILDLYSSNSVFDELEKCDSNNEYVAMVINDKIVSMVGSIINDNNEYYICDSVIDENYKDSNIIEELTEYLSDYLSTWRLSTPIIQKKVTKS